MNASLSPLARRTSQLLRPLPAALAFAALLALVAPLQPARAAPVGVTAQPMGIGVLAEPVRMKFKAEDGGFGVGTAVEDIVMVRFTIAPGGSFGWHEHGGPVWVVVQQGTLTLYDGDDASCTGRAQIAGSAFLDSGRHVHNARNEGDIPVVVLATFMLPDGGALRTDVANPGVCPF